MDQVSTPAPDAACTCREGCQPARSIVVGLVVISSLSLFAGLVAGAVSLTLAPVLAGLGMAMTMPVAIVIFAWLKHLRSETAIAPPIHQAPSASA